MINISNCIRKESSWKKRSWVCLLTFVSVHRSPFYQNKLYLRNDFFSFFLFQFLIIHNKITLPMMMLIFYAAIYLCLSFDPIICIMTDMKKEKKEKYTGNCRKNLCYLHWWHLHNFFSPFPPYRLLSILKVANLDARLLMENSSTELAL